jgi:chromosome partitioning protein
MSHIIAISNQKGGVGKTTSAVSVAAELAEAGSRVLLVDFDPQGNATSGLGVEFNEEGQDLYDVFFGRVSLGSILRPSCVQNLVVAPSSKDLVSIEIELGKTPGRELILKSEIALLTSHYDYIIIDCPPSSGLLTLNALGACEHILIPLQAEYYALEGITGLLSTIKFVQGTFNPRLSILGVFLTMYDARTNLSTQVEAEAANHFGDLLLEERIPRNIRLSEAPSHGLPICQYAPQSAGALAYKRLTSIIMERCNRLLSGAMVANG